MIRVRITILMIMLSTGITSMAQHQLPTSQFFLNAPMINPAFTGVDDFLDIKAGYRQQWTGIDDAPRGFFLGAYYAIEKPSVAQYQQQSLRISDPTAYTEARGKEKKGLRHGVGLSLYKDNQFVMEQLNLSLYYALHIKLSRNTTLTLGTSASLFDRMIDESRLEVRDPNDNTYQTILQNGARQTFIEANFGALLYGKNFYVGFAALPAVQSLVRSNNDLEQTKKEILYNASLGYQFDLGVNWRMQLSTLLKYDNIDDFNYEANLKFRMKDIFWTGLSYRSNDSMTLLFGTFVGDRFTIGYSYDFFLNNLNATARGTHELVLGIAVLKGSQVKPYAW